VNKVVAFVVTCILYVVSVSASPLTGTPIDPVLICEPGSPDVVATGATWSMNFWTGDPITEFTINDDSATIQMSGWIDSSIPDSWVLFAESADGFMEMWVEWADDSANEVFEFTISVVHAIWGTTTETTTISYADISTLLEGIIIDECDKAAVVEPRALPIIIVLGGAIVGAVAVGGKVASCALDTYDQAIDGVNGCALTFPPATDPVNFDQCTDCVEAKFHRDLANCVLLWGLNGPDNDYANCIAAGWAQPGGNPAPVGTH